jgi:hypothetical protein
VALVSATNPGRRPLWQGNTGANEGDDLPCPAPDLSCDAPDLPCNGLEGHALRRLGYTELAVAALPVLGITARLHADFPCRLPGHDSHAAFVVRDDRTGTLRYRCRDLPARAGWLSLPELRASLAAGKMVRLSNGLSVVWYLRVWAEAGLCSPLPVRLPLPPYAAGPLRQVADGFELLCGLRQRAGYRDPTPFASRFIPPWCGVSHGQGTAAFRRLVELGAVSQVGELPGRPKPTPVFRPGTAHE